MPATKAACERSLLTTEPRAAGREWMGQLRGRNLPDRAQRHAGDPQPKPCSHAPRSRGQHLLRRPGHLWTSEGEEDAVVLRVYAE